MTYDAKLMFELAFVGPKISRSTWWKRCNPERSRELNRLSKSRHKDDPEWVARQRMLNNKSYHKRKAEDPDRVRAMLRRWWVDPKNKGKVAALSMERYVRKLQATPPWANRGVIQAIYEDAAGKGWHVDHIVPLKSKLVCGLHCEANLRPPPPAENISKGNRWWPDMW